MKRNIKVGIIVVVLGLVILIVINWISLHRAISSGNDKTGTVESK